MHFVYQFINLNNRRNYSGRTQDFMLRFKNHINSLNKGIHIIPDLQKDFDRGHVFKFVVSTFTNNIKIATKTERSFIKHDSYNRLRNYYNKPYEWRPSDQIKIGIFYKKGKSVVFDIMNHAHKIGEPRTKQ